MDDRRRYQLAPGFAVVPADDAVWLVAGEDVRYRLAVAEPAVLVAVLAQCEGRPLDEAAAVAGARHAEARGILGRLVEERVLVESGPSRPAAWGGAMPAVRVVGEGALGDRTRGALAAAGIRVVAGPATVGRGGASGDALVVFVQDRLDHAAVLAHNRTALATGQRWLWVTTGPGARAYVSPLFVPDAGPCAECVLVHFKRLSPVPALYDAVIAHGEAGAAMPVSQMAEPVIALALAVTVGKLALAGAPVAVPALFALHVIEARDLAVSLHVPIADRDCAACRPAGRP